MFKTRIYFSRLHNPGQLKSSRFSWTTGQGSTNIRLHPFRPSVPEKPYSSKISAFDSTFSKPSVPVHALLPIIHQSSFEPVRAENGSFSYFNLNSNPKVPSTVLESPSASIDTYALFGNALKQSDRHPGETERPQNFIYVSSTRAPEVSSPNPYFHLPTTSNYDHPRVRVSSTTENWRPSTGSAYNQQPTQIKLAQYETNENSEEDEDFNPPPYFYNNYNKYENAVNPFADPGFNFDKYLQGLELLHTTAAPTRKPKIQTPRPFKSTTEPTTKIPKFGMKLNESIYNYYPVTSTDNHLDLSRPETDQSQYSETRSRVKTARKQNFRTQSNTNSNRLNNESDRDLTDNQYNRLPDHKYHR